MPAASSRVFGNDVQAQQKYSSLTGLIYVFNLIVGTGALTLPGAFGTAGWALGVAFILLLALLSYMTATFVVEAMSIGNAMLAGKRREKDSVDESPSESRILQSSTSRRERDPLIPSRFGDDSEDLRFAGTSGRSIFEINQRLELGRMASMFLGRVGLYLFYLCLAVYLYGDLAIYIAAVAKSLRDVACVYVPPNNGTSNETNPLTDETFCWSDGDGVTREGAYRLFAIIFLVTLGPFCFFNVTKTKYLQLFTSSMRWTAFILMIGLASNKIMNGQGTGHPFPARISALPNLFGICVYSFMCHHSLPSLITPFSTKRKIYSLLGADYLLITVFYLLLALTGVFAFDQIQDLYTLNFEPQHAGDPNVFPAFLQYFLALFPVFTLSTNFPIIAITLKNNLKSLFQVVDEEDEDLGEETESEDESGTLGYPSLNVPLHRTTLPEPPTTICCRLLSKAGFPILAILPPFLVAFLVQDVQFLVGFTGSYAGAGIQYVTPALLVLNARKQRRIRPELNPYASPFGHVAWVWLVLIWSVVSILFITIHRFMAIEVS